MLAIVVGMRCQPAQSFQAYFKRPPPSIVIPLPSPSISTLLFKPIRTSVNNGGYLPFDLVIEAAKDEYARDHPGADRR
jgi:hypothetical protein